MKQGICFDYAVLLHAVLDIPLSCSVAPLERKHSRIVMRKSLPRVAPLRVSVALNSADANGSAVRWNLHMHAGVCSCVRFCCRGKKVAQENKVSPLRGTIYGFVWQVRIQHSF